MARPHRTTLGPHVNEGVRLLWRKLCEQDVLQADAARRLEILPDRLNKILYGDAVATLAEAVRISDAYDIPVPNFVKKPKRPIALPANR